MMALSRCAINDNYLAVFSYFYILIIYHFYLSKPYSFLSAQMPSYPKFSKEGRHIRPYAIPSVFQHLNQSPQHIPSALLDYKALRAGPYLIQSLIPLLVVPHPVLYTGKLLLLQPSAFQSAPSIYKRTNLLDWICIQCMTLVEKVVSGLQALFAYLHNGNHIIYLIKKTTVRNTRVRR